MFALKYTESNLFFKNQFDTLILEYNEYFFTEK